MHKEDIPMMDSEDDPQRCQGIIAGKQQCNKKAVPGSNYCPLHGANSRIQAIKAESLRNYRLTKFRKSVQEKSNSSAIKSLRDEVGILRMMLEEKLNMCEDVHDLILQSGPIGQMVLNIERVVTSCHKLEDSMGQLLDSQAVLRFANRIIDIIGENIQDTEVLEKIANQIMGEVSESV